MNRLLAIFTSAAVLAACGPVTSLITDGTYTSGNDMTLPSATLVVDRSAKTATLTPDGGTAVVLSLVEVPRASWNQGCPTNFTSVAVETFSLTPDPAVLGTLTIGAPKLTAGCGLDSADPDAVRIEGNADGGLSVILNFTRVQR